MPPCDIRSPAGIEGSLTYSYEKHMLKARCGLAYAMLRFPKAGSFPIHSKVHIPNIEGDEKAPCSSYTNAAMAW